MSTASEPTAEPYVVLAAWQCDPCDVQGRSLDADVECWNCGGDVTVTARPAVRIADLEPMSPILASTQRTGAYAAGGSPAPGDDPDGVLLPFGLHHVPVQRSRTE